MTDDLRYDIAREAARHELELDDETIAALARYVALLERWGARIRLTGESAPRVVIQRHLADAFAAAALLAPSCGDERLPTLDVGSGAGLPGLPLARVLPTLALVSVEARQRKASFQRSAAHELGLEVTVHAARLESLQDQLAGRFAVALSRATFAPERWLERALPLLSTAGRVLVFTASRDDLPSPPPGYSDERLERSYALQDGTPRCIAIYARSSEAA